MKLLNSKKFVIVICLLILFTIDGFSQNQMKKEENCEPSIPNAQILRAISFDGIMSVGSMDTRCFPMPKERVSVYDYDPYKGAKLTTSIKHSGGSLINKYVWYAQRISYGKNFPPGLKFIKYEIIGGREALKELSPGEYVLEFAIDDKVFQTFPFSVQIKKSRDPYNPGTIYLIDGAWRDKAILEVPGLEGKTMCLNFWMRTGNDFADVKPQSIPYEIRLIRDKDKKVMAANSTTKTLYLGNTWKFYRECFRNPDIPINQRDDTLQFKEILAVNSGYTINLSVNGKPYAVYKFTVNNRKVNGEELPARRILINLPAKILSK